MTRRRLLRSLWIAGSAATMFMWFGSVNAAEPDPKVMSYKLPKDILWQGDAKVS